jgi:predicted  nucleic acid-binding Zn-ribbon protein
MRDVITKLLVLQDRDRRIIALQEELARIAPDRQELQTKAASGQAALEAAKTLVKQLESERKRLELEVEGKKGLIEKYSLQQFQTKKNEEYRALAHEIDMCKEAISGFEDQQLEIMEKADVAQRAVTERTREAADIKKTADGRLADLAGREENLRMELAELTANRAELAEAVEDPARSRYERLLKSKGGNIVVGISGSVCGGCHMTLSRQVVVSCRAEQELQLCPNCGRILYCSPEMDIAATE